MDRWITKPFFTGHGRSTSYAHPSREPTLNPTKPRRIRCLLVGNTGVGKTSLVATFARGHFPTTDTVIPTLYEPTVAINFTDASKSLPRQSVFSRSKAPIASTSSLPSGEFGQLPSSCKLVHITVQDLTTVDSAAWSLKGLDPSYAAADVVMIVYSIDDSQSFEDVWYKWFKEVSDFCPKAPMILVACKSDLQTEMTSSPQQATLISHRDGTMMAQQIFAHSFIETSSKTLHNVDLAFASAARAVLRVADQEAKQVSQKKMRKKIDGLKEDIGFLWEKIQDMIHPPPKDVALPTPLI